MTPLARLLVVGTLLGGTVLQAQNFSGSDDFSGVTASWSTDTVTNGGAFTVSGGVLNFTDSGLAGGQSSSAYRDWTLNLGSYTADWQVQVDLSFNNLPQVASQLTSLTLVVANFSDTNDFARLSFQQSYMMSATRSFSASVYTNNVSQMDTGWLNTAATTVTVRASYLAASNELSLAYDDGTGFTNVFTSTVGGLGWGMGPTDMFGLRLVATNLTNSGPTTAVGLGQVYADNFVVSPTAPIPEPSTYAASLGALALLAAGLRRFRQQ